jgi:hypothetical protein
MSGEGLTLLVRNINVRVSLKSIFMDIGHLTHGSQNVHVGRGRKIEGRPRWATSEQRRFSLAPVLTIVPTKRFRRAL